MTVYERHRGVTSEPRYAVVEAGFLKLFAKATGEPNPIHYDEHAARAAGHPDIVAPPTYLFSLGLAEPPPQGALFDEEYGFGLDLARILHAEQGFTYHKPIYAGDRVRLTTTTTDIHEKKGGALLFIVQETRGENAAGELCATMRFVTVVRQ